MPPAVSDTHRLDALESALRQLTRDVVELRHEVRRLSGDTSAAPATLAAPPAPLASPLAPFAASAVPPRRPRRPIDVEALVGRYGAMALAALTILMAAGTFLGWAIANNKLGPEARVTLGGVGAALVAAVGLRLRARGARRFGNALLGLALALVHVDVWGAGPTLGLLAPPAALAIAALASAAIAALAWREGEQPLFMVGTGGALLAPFVASAGEGSTLVLLVYGWVVLTTALYGARGRSWPAADRLLVIGCAVFVVAAMDATWDTAGRLMQGAPALFALGCAWSALALGDGARRGVLARSFAAAALVPLLAYATTPRRFVDFLVLAALGTVTSYAALRLSDAVARRWRLEAVALPSGFLLAALVALPDTTSIAGALVALGWGAVALAAAWDAGRRAPDETHRRAPHLMLAGLVGALAVPLAFDDHRFIGTALLSAAGAGIAFFVPRARTLLLAVPAAAALALASYWALDLLALRPAYGYMPFVGRASLAAALVVAAWTLFARWTSRAELDDAAGFGPMERGLVSALGALAAFWWGRTELAHAFSRELATFLLIFYYAAAGVLVIFVGRWRQRAPVRRVGLALAIYAALKAVAQASELRSVGLQVGSYLAVGCFLLGVAYWYRAAGEGAGDDGGAALDAGMDVVKK